MMKPLYRTRRLAVLNLAERGLLGCRSRPIGVVVTEGVVEQEWARGGTRARGRAREGTAKKAEGCRRGWKGTQGARYLTSPFLCPQPPSLVFDSLFFLFQGERRRPSVLLFTDRPLAFLVADLLVILSCLPPLALFGPRYSFCPSSCSLVLSSLAIRENRYCFIIPGIVAICDPSFAQILRYIPFFFYPFLLLARHALCLSIRPFLSFIISYPFPSMTLISFRNT